MNRKIVLVIGNSEYEDAGDLATLLKSADSLTFLLYRRAEATEHA